MEGVIDLSYESLSDKSNIPDTVGQGWIAAELSESDWTIPVSDEALEEIDQMVVLMRNQPLPMLLRNVMDYNIIHLRALYNKVKKVCDCGAGFAVIDKLPIDEYDIDEMLAVYWVLGQLLGTNVAQKWNGTMIYDVTDTGQKYGYGVRGSATNVELVFHTDNAFGIAVPDYVGLLCKYPAKTGGLSRFCSLYTVHHRLAEQYPQALKRLYKPVYFDRQAEHAPGEPKTTLAPMFSWQNGRLRCRANSSLVRKGYEVAGMKMDHDLANALDAIDDITSSSDLWIEAPLRRGQVQYLNNHELGHYRSDFVDHSDQSKKRHLYRLWHRNFGRVNYDG